MKSAIALVKEGKIQESLPLYKNIKETLNNQEIYNFTEKKSHIIQNSCNSVI